MSPSPLASADPASVSRHDIEEGNVQKEEAKVAKEAENLAESQREEILQSLEKYLKEQGASAARVCTCTASNA